MPNFYAPSQNVNPYTDQSSIVVIGSGTAGDGKYNVRLRASASGIYIGGPTMYFNSGQVFNGYALTANTEYILSGVVFQNTDWGGSSAYQNPDQLFAINGTSSAVFLNILLTPTDI
jgi:hypothetical protein